MGLGIGINAQQPDAGKLKGRQEAIACGVWFTSTGQAMPKMLKFQRDDGEIRTISPIHTLSCEKKNYCGIPTLEYRCCADFEGCRYSFYLLYYIERQEWKVLWKDVKTCADDIT